MKYIPLREKSRVGKATVGETICTECGGKFESKRGMVCPACRELESRRNTRWPKQYKSSKVIKTGEIELKPIVHNYPHELVIAGVELDFPDGKERNLI